jgi:IS5 family transposase
MLEEVNLHLDERGIRIPTGTIVDATMIHESSSTMNQTGQCDPEMHQTRKGNQWDFGLKSHVSVWTARRWAFGGDLGGKLGRQPSNG